MTGVEFLCNLRCCIELWLAIAHWCMFRCSWLRLINVVAEVSWDVFSADMNNIQRVFFASIFCRWNIAAVFFWMVFIAVHVTTCRLYVFADVCRSALCFGVESACSDMSRLPRPRRMLHDTCIVYCCSCTLCFQCAVIDTSMLYGCSAAYWLRVRIRIKTAAFFVWWCSLIADSVSFEVMWDATQWVSARISIVWLCPLPT